MKKWLTFLLLLITFVTTFYPCCSKDNCCNDEFKSNTTNHNNHKSEGNCSPFVACSSCSGFIQMVNVVEVPSIQEVKTIHHSKVVTLTLSTYTTSLLQPPQVA